MKGYWRPRGGHAGGDHRGRLVPHGRPRPRRRGRLRLRGRAAEGHDHPRRASTSTRARSRRCSTSIPAVAEAAVVGLPGRTARRGGRRRRSCCGPGRRSELVGAARLGQGARRALQVPAPALVRRRAPEGPDGQDPQAGDRPSPRRRRARRPLPRLSAGGARAQLRRGQGRPRRLAGHRARARSTACAGTTAPGKSTLINDAGRASSPPTRARSASTASLRAVREPARRPAGGHRLRRPGAEPRPVADDRREHRPRARRVRASCAIRGATAASRGSC